jgi:hypothetical protein
MRRRSPTTTSPYVWPLTRLGQFSRRYTAPLALSGRSSRSGARSIAPLGAP